MMKLMSLKKKHGWSLLIIAHTPKRNMSNPITQNDLAGSSKSAKDTGLRYIKQLKVRAGEYRYDSDNVIVCEIDPGDGFLHFESVGHSTEKEHLRPRDGEEDTAQMQNVLDLKSQGKTVRDIAAILGLSKSAAGRILKKAETLKTQQTQP